MISYEMNEWMAEVKNERKEEGVLLFCFFGGREGERDGAFALALALLLLV